MSRPLVERLPSSSGKASLDYKAKPTQKSIPNEAGNGLKNLRGTVGLARASGPHTGDCQFYVNVADNADLDPLPTRWGFAVFGRVIEGMEVVDRIAAMPTRMTGPHADAFHTETLQALNALGLPYLLAGTYAVSAYTGITRPTKDLDIFCKAGDYTRVLSHFKSLGYSIEIEDDRWLGKVFKGQHVPHPDIVEAKRVKLSIESERPLRIEADGEVLGYTPASFEVLRDALSLKV